MNDRTTATSVSTAISAGSATTAGLLVRCDWWPWLYVISLEPSPYTDRTPLPRPVMSTDTY